MYDFSLYLSTTSSIKCYKYYEKLIDFVHAIGVIAI